MQNKCRICDSDQIANKRKGSAKLIHCKDCDVYYLEKFPDNSELQKYYSEDYDLHSSSGDIIEDEHRRIFRSTENLYLISEMMKYVETGKNVVDIGCDKGFFLDEARRFGYNVFGVEPMKSSAAYATNIGIDIKKTISEHESKFDAAVMWHSLEHFTEPYSILNDISEKLNDNGYIFIRVPAFDSVWSKLLGKYWIWFQPENHYFHYSNKSLGTLLNRAGFSLEKIAMRYPNDRFTKKMNSNLNSFFTYAFGRKVSIRKRLSRIYQDMTGVELFAVAKKIENS
jgi:SAM-dependent methyltransferase